MAVLPSLKKHGQSCDYNAADLRVAKYFVSFLPYFLQPQFLVVMCYRLLNAHLYGSNS